MRIALCDPSKSFGYHLVDVQGEDCLLTNRASGLDELQEILVYLVRKRGAHAMWSAFVDFEHRVFDNLTGRRSRIRNRPNLIIVAVEDQGRNIDLLEVLGQIRLRKKPFSIGWLLRSLSYVDTQRYRSATTSL